MCSRTLRIEQLSITMAGKDCGSAGRAVPFDSRGPRFESSHWQKFVLKKQK